MKKPHLGPLAPMKPSRDFTIVLLVIVAIAVVAYGIGVLWNPVPVTTPL